MTCFREAFVEARAENLLPLDSRGWRCHLEVYRHAEILDGWRIS